VVQYVDDDDFDFQVCTDAIPYDNCMVVPTCYNRAKKANKMEMTPAVNIDSIDDRLINK